MRRPDPETDFLAFSLPDAILVSMAWLMLDHAADAIAALTSLRQTTGLISHFCTAVRAAAQGQRAGTVVAIDHVAVGADPGAERR